MAVLRVEQYFSGFENKWDKFIKDSINGTFLQTRNFLNYHPKDKFNDNSLIIFKGEDTIVGVIPACVTFEDSQKNFYSHLGSTFGGIIINKFFNDVEHVGEMFNVINNYLKENNFNKIILKNTSDLFSRGNTKLIDYFLFKEGFLSYEEISFYIDFKDYKEDILSNFSSSRRRDYKYSLKSNLTFKKINTNEEIEKFYNILCNNLKKFNTKPVHTLNELFDLKENRLKGIIEFYGTFLNNNLIAGSMVFKFDNKVFHTQYLAADQNHLDLYPMNYLNTNLINTAKEEKFKYFSFGISTEEHGRILNYNLAKFKEGFGATYSINRTHYKEL